MDCRYAPSCTADEWSRDDKLLVLIQRRFTKMTDEQQAFPVARFARHELRELPQNFRLVRRSRGYGFEVGRVTPCAPLSISVRRAEDCAPYQFALRFRVNS